MSEERKKRIPDYQQLRAGINTIEAVVDAHRRQGKSFQILATFRLDGSFNDNWDGKCEETRVEFSMQYNVKAHSSYVKVLWKPVMVLQSEGERTFFRDNTEWVEIADHDTCWRACESPIIKWVRENSESRLEWKNVSAFFNCEWVTVIELHPKG